MPIRSCCSLTDALVGVLSCGSCPRPVVVERLTALAVHAGGVVSTLAGQLLSLGAGPMMPRPRPSTGRPGSTAGAARQGRDRTAARRVPVALAPAADGEVRQGVEPTAAGTGRFAVVVVGRDPLEHHANVRRRHPVLQHRADVELAR